MDFLCVQFHHIINRVKSTYRKELSIMNTNHSTEKTKKIILTSKNSPELKEKMRRISAELIKRNQELYKRLENK